MYQISVAYDGKAIHFNQNYADALEAFTAFNKFVDWGWANEYATVNLQMPTGKMYTRIFYREGRKVVTK
jgi:hypothetical protein